MPPCRTHRRPPRPKLHSSGGRAPTLLACADIAIYLSSENSAPSVARHSAGHPPPIQTSSLRSPQLVHLLVHFQLTPIHRSSRVHPGSMSRGSSRQSRNRHTCRGSNLALDRSWSSSFGIHSLRRKWRHLHPLLFNGLFASIHSIHNRHSHI